MYRSVPDADTAWHCGDTSYRHPECRNSNSIGIEICSRRDIFGNYYLVAQAVDRASELTKEKMTEYGISADCVVRHYDVTGKICPAPFVQDGGQWQAFKNRLAEGEDDMARYQKLGDIPNDYKLRDIVETLMNAGIICGDGSDATGNDDVIDLSHDQVRTLVFLYRGGAFDRKLIAVGMNPAVSA